MFGVKNTQVIPLMARIYPKSLYTHMHQYYMYYKYRNNTHQSVDTLLYIQYSYSKFTSLPLRFPAKDVGDGWRGGSQVDRKATERVYAGGKDTERVEDGPDVPIWKRKGRP